MNQKRSLWFFVFIWMIGGATVFILYLVPERFTDSAIQLQCYKKIARVAGFIWCLLVISDLYVWIKSHRFFQKNASKEMPHDHKSIGKIRGETVSDFLNSQEDADFDITRMFSKSTSSDDRRDLIKKN